MLARPFSTLQPSRSGRFAALAAFLVLGVSGTWAASNSWVWVDAAGRRIYSDMPPPPTVSDKQILQQPGQARVHIQTWPTTPPALPSAETPTKSAAAGTANTAPKTTPDAATLKKQREEEQAAEAKRKAVEAQNAAIRAENCKRAQSQQAMLQSGVRMHTMTPAGEPVVYDDAMRASELARVQRSLADNCR